MTFIQSKEFKIMADMAKQNSEAQTEFTSGALTLAVKNFIHLIAESPLEEEPKPLFKKPETRGYNLMNTLLSIGSSFEIFPSLEEGYIVVLTLSEDFISAFEKNESFISMEGFLDHMGLKLGKSYEIKQDNFIIGEYNSVYPDKVNGSDVVYIKLEKYDG